MEDSEIEKRNWQYLTYEQTERLLKAWQEFVVWDREEVLNSVYFSVIKNISSDLQRIGVAGYGFFDPRNEYHTPIHETIKDLWDGESVAIICDKGPFVDLCVREWIIKLKDVEEL